MHYLINRRQILLLFTISLLSNCAPYPLTILFKDHKMETYQVDHFMEIKKYTDTPQFEICLAENDSIILFDLKSVLWYQLGGDWHRYKEDWQPLVVKDSSEYIQIYSTDMIFYPIPISFPKYYFSSTLDGTLYPFKKKHLIEQFPQDTALHQFLSDFRVRKRNRETGQFMIVALLNE